MATPTAFATITAAQTTPALTTIFTPPASCLQRTYTVGQPGSDVISVPDQGKLSVYRGYTSDCFPTNAALSGGYVYFSPGLCPSAYSIASLWREQETTFATCCPWFMHASSAYYDCGTSPESTSVKVYSHGTAIEQAAYAWDTAIVIAWHSSDLSLLARNPTETGTWDVPTDIAPPLTAQNNVSQTSIQQTPVPTLLNAPMSNNSSGLSVGAKAGIGVGISLGVIFLAAVAFWFGRKSQSRRNAGPRHGKAEGYVTCELPDDNMLHELGPSHKHTAELEGQTPVELQANILHDRKR